MNRTKHTSPAARRPLDRAGCASVADLPVMPLCRDGEPHPCTLDRGHGGPHECRTCGATWDRGPWDDDVDDALAVVAAGRTLDAERARLASRVEAERAVARAGRLTLAEKVAVALDARLGHLIGEDSLFSATVDDVVAVLDAERA